MADNNIPGDIDLLRPWFSFIRRMRQEMPSTGVGVATIRVVMDERGTPVFWSEPEFTRLEPRSSAGASLKDILELLTC